MPKIRGSFLPLCVGRLRIQLHALSLFTRWKSRPLSSQRCFQMPLNTVSCTQGRRTLGIAFQWTSRALLPLPFLCRNTWIVESFPSPLFTSWKVERHIIYYFHFPKPEKVSGDIVMLGLLTSFWTAPSMPEILVIIPNLYLLILNHLLGFLSGWFQYSFQFADLVFSSGDDALHAANLVKNRIAGYVACYCSVLHRLLEIAFQISDFGL